MLRLRLLIPLALGALGALVAILVEMREPADSEGLGAGVAQSLARPAAVAPDPSTDNDEALAAWFQDQVMLHLERGEAASQPGDLRRAAAGGDIVSPHPFQVASARAAGPSDEERAGSVASERSRRQINWSYLEDVFEGRISGIPNETKAGINLQEIDELGDIPYIEQLREEGRYEELRELGFENETTPWPACLRKGACRLDSASSPP
jgi:hypothetical protein